MTADDRARALLALVAAQLEDLRAQQALKRDCLVSPRVSAASVRRVWAGKNTTIVTLLDIADLVDADVEIILHKRAS